MAGIVIDTANFQHPNTTPRTLRVAAELVEAGAPLSDISRPPLPDQAQPPAAAVRARARPAQTATDGRVVWSTPARRGPAATGAPPAHSEGLIDLLASRRRPRSRSCSRRPARRQRGSVRTKPGGVDATELTGAFGGGGHARAAGATQHRRRPGAAPVLPRPSRLAAPPRPTRPPELRTARAPRPGRRHPRRRQAHRADVARHRRSRPPPGGRRRVGHGGTLDPFAAGVLPVFLGRATRLVEYHLADASVPRDGRASARPRRRTTSRAS